MTAPTPPQHEIRALHTDTTVTVYQAYAPSLGLPAARDGRFPSAWKRDRMTWIKPSFLWTMYRCGWATKEGQETVLAVDIAREGFDWALANAELSHHERGVHPDLTTWKRSLRHAPTRVQWDPERDLHLNRLPYRSLQLGLAGEAARRYVDGGDPRRHPAGPGDPRTDQGGPGGEGGPAAAGGAGLPGAGGDPGVRGAPRRPLSER